MDFVRTLDIFLHIFLGIRLLIIHVMLSSHHPLITHSRTHTPCTVHICMNIGSSWTILTGIARKHKSKAVPGSVGANSIARTRKAGATTTTEQVPTVATLHSRNQHLMQPPPSFRHNFHGIASCCNRMHVLDMVARGDVTSPAVSSSPTPYNRQADRAVMLAPCCP